MLIAQTICITQGNRDCRLQQALQFPSGNTLEADENDPPATSKTKKKLAKSIKHHYGIEWKSTMPVVGL
jgi:hypothetical protein